MLISNPIDVGAAVRQRRIDLGMSQTELAERIDTTRQWMSRFEQGKADVTLSRALAILRQLDLVVDLQPRVRVTRPLRAIQPIGSTHANPPILTARLTDAPPSSRPQAPLATQPLQPLQANESSEVR